eukprot:757980-Hanusia_phi.AAC.1
MSNTTTRSPNVPPPPGIGMPSLVITFRPLHVLLLSHRQQRRAHLGEARGRDGVVFDLRCKSQGVGGETGLLASTE